MKKIYSLIIGLGLVLAAFSQPYNFTQPINPKDTGLVTSTTRRQWDMQFIKDGITVDGVKDVLWDSITSKTLDKYILGATNLENGVYSFKANNMRMPSSPDDFSGFFRIAYDSDYIYTIYDITDNEVNDGVINAGLTERLEFVEAPYVDSAPQLLNRTNGLVNYPPFSGSAPDLNMKFCYWAYLGAFKINFFLDANDKCKITFDERSDAMAKIDYAQRASAIQCAWKPKSDGTGYIFEAGLSLKVTLADSSNTPYKLPKKGEVKFIAFDMFTFDYDFDLKDKPVKASWNAEDDIVWDAMLYTGKLRILGWGVGLEDASLDEIGFYPNPAKEIITFKKNSNVEIISMTGSTVKSAKNVNSLNVEDLSSGIYVIMIDGKPAGKMTK